MKPATFGVIALSSLAVTFAVHHYSSPQHPRLSPETLRDTLKSDQVNLGDTGDVLNKARERAGEVARVPPRLERPGSDPKGSVRLPDEVWGPLVEVAQCVYRITERGNMFKGYFTTHEMDMSEYNGKLSYLYLRKQKLVGAGFSVLQGQVALAKTWEFTIESDGVVRDKVEVRTSRLNMSKQGPHFAPEELDIRDSEASDLLRDEIDFWIGQRDKVCKGQK